MRTEGRGTLAGQQLGSYQLLSLLGTGGMAEVYLAQDLALNRQVAVKVLPAALASDSEYARRFENEARQIAALKHPHIVPVYYFGSSDGRLYLVMPVLSETLRDRLERAGALPPEEAVGLVQQIASGLEAAHALGIVHRDVKPENILLDSEGQAMLGDFGIARQLGLPRSATAAPTLGASGLPIGTPEYMAPEQLRGEAADQRADIYGLGTVLFELLTGTVPFEADSPYEVASLAMTAPVPLPSERQPGIWPTLEAAVLRAVARDPAERYPTAQAFAHALELALLEHAGRGGGESAAGGQTLTPRLAVPTRVLTSAGPSLGGTLTSLGGTLPGAAARGTGRWPEKRTRALALGAAAVLLFATLCGVGATRLLVSGGALGQSGDGSVPASGSLAATATATASGGRGGLPAGPGSTASVGSGARTPTPRSSVPATPAASPGSSPAPGTTPSPGASPTTTQPMPTPTPEPALSLSPADMTLTHQGPNCSGSQTITNSSQQTVGWQWLSVGKLPPSFQYRVNAFPFTTGWPQDWSAGIPPGESDQLQVQAHMPDCNKLPSQVTGQDSQGATYTLSLTVS